uniref:Uncharacterized protein n=1 Tax=Arundo donax TaxID=35708 RepID=A0A0A9F9Z5_ARUDO
MPAAARRGKREAAAEAEEER